MVTMVGVNSYIFHEWKDYCHIVKITRIATIVYTCKLLIFVTKGYPVFNLPGKQGLQWKFPQNKMHLLLILH